MRVCYGLPLMGCGDWNDGMNQVGAGGGLCVQPAPPSPVVVAFTSTGRPRHSGD